MVCSWGWLLPHRYLSAPTLMQHMADGWCQQLTKFFDKPGQLRSCRPGSVRRASVPSRFQHVNSPGVAPQVNESGTSPDGTSNSPTTLHVLANGPGLDHRDCPPQASPIRVCPDRACTAISAAWSCLRWRFRLALPMPLLIERVVHVFCCIVIGIRFVVAERTSKHLSPLCFHPCAASE